MPWFLTSTTPLGARKICPVAFTDQAEAETFAALAAFTANTPVAVEDMETPGDITPIPAAIGVGAVPRKRGK